MVNQHHIELMFGFLSDEMDRLKQTANTSHQCFNALTLPIDLPVEGRLGKQSEKDPQFWTSRTYVDRTPALFTLIINNNLEGEIQDTHYCLMSLFVSHKDSESALCI